MFNFDMTPLNKLAENKSLQKISQSTMYRHLKRNQNQQKLDNKIEKKELKDIKKTQTEIDKDNINEQGTQDED
jgi:hypothetical protein